MTGRAGLLLLWLVGLLRWLQNTLKNQWFLSLSSKMMTLSAFWASGSPTSKLDYFNFGEASWGGPLEASNLITVSHFERRGFPGLPRDPPRSPRDPPRLLQGPPGILRGPPRDPSGTPQGPPEAPQSNIWRQLITFEGFFHKSIKSPTLF